MKITAKTTKQELKDFLGANVKAVQKKDKELFDRISYADKMAKKDDSKVSRKDLVDLAKDVINLLGDKIVTPALAEEKPAKTSEPKAENSVKKLNSKKKKKEAEESSEESSDSEETAQTEEQVDDKKSAKKSLGGKKKNAPKKDGVTALEGSENQKTVQMAKMFPQTLKVGDAKYELAEDIQSMEDLYKAVEELGDGIVFAYYWTERHLKQFSYFNGLLGQPKSFDNDLDLATAIFVSEELRVCYQTSAYTDAIYTILPQDIPSEDGIRYTCGMEYQIYRAV